MRKMRRSERLVTDITEIISVLDKCDICHLGLIDENKPYVVPLNYGYEYKADKLVLYFHGALEGRKIDVINSSGFAAFEMECDYRLKTDETACNHSSFYKSIIGEGKIEIIKDSIEKSNGLNLVMAHNTGKSDWTFPEMMVNKVSVIRLTVDEFTCKEHIS